MTRNRTPEQIKAALMQELREQGEELEELDEAVWQVLLDLRYVGEAQQGLLRTAELADKYIEYRHVLGMATRLRPRGRPREERHEQPPDQRLALLSEAMAQQAARDPQVVAFRQQALDGRLLAPEEVAAWIRAQAGRDGPARPVIEAALPDGYDVELDPSWSGAGQVPWVIKPPVTLTHSIGVRQLLLAYQEAGRGAVARVVVRPGSVLDTLRLLAQALSRRYSWTEDQATTFVLTGLTPFIPRARITVHRTFPLQMLSRVALDLDPHVSPQEVLALYRRYRAELLRGRYRPLSPKHLELARFYASNQGVSWQRLMEEWNGQQPQWRYTDRRNFSRDCRHALRRIFGEEEE